MEVKDGEMAGTRRTYFVICSPLSMPMLFPAGYISQFSGLTPPTWTGGA
jgi:hypothetical protein